MNKEEYQKSWPAGLVRYEVSKTISIPEVDRLFLQEVGLPVGREPEWVFTGTLIQVAELYQFGTHCTYPLMIDQTGAIKEILEGRATFMNSSVVGLAACLTLRKRSSRGRVELRTEADIQKFAEMFLELDARCLTPGGYWELYIQEVREEMMEINSQ